MLSQSLIENIGIGCYHCSQGSWDEDSVQPSWRTRGKEVVRLARGRGRCSGKGAGDKSV